MKAITYEKYGTPSMMKLEEVNKPVPKPDEVLLKVASASINPYDYIHVLGKPYLVRLTSGLFKPKQRIRVLGADIAGTVESVGSKVTRFKVGDEVFGEAGYGSFAEYASVREKALSKKPTNISFEEAASSGMVGLTALQGLRKGEIEAGQHVLINGASGGIGTFAVQLAKFFGTTVTGVCSTKNLDMVKSIGADQVIDYTNDKFTSPESPYAGSFDLIIDTIGNLSVADYQALMKADGTCVVLGYTTGSRMMEVMAKGSWVSSSSKQRIVTMTAQVVTEDLEFLGELMETGKLKPVIDRSYPLNEVPKALDYLRERHAQGKVVITV